MKEENLCLWAPWRVEYLLKERDESCFLCDSFREGRDRENLILKRGDSSFIVMNRYPYNPGHLMIAPNRHTGDLEGLNPEELDEIISLLKYSISLLKRVMKPHGFNAGLNIGRVAGAGLEEHIHLHLVPRWNGDTNFMPVMKAGKVIPEHLLSTYDKLKKGMERTVEGTNRTKLRTKRPK